MARLSVEDLNNLSGVSNVDLDTLHKAFKKSYVKLINDVRRWTREYKSKCRYVSSTNDDTYTYRVYRRLYYEGNIILDDINMFVECTTDYQGLLNKLNKISSIREIVVMNELMYKEKTPMINYISNCYGLYQEAYEKLNKEE